MLAAFTSAICELGSTTTFTTSFSFTNTFVTSVSFILQISAGIVSISFDPSLVVEAGFSASVGRRALSDWLKKNKKDALPDAIFCASDPMAVGCLEALAEVGIRVPEDISVTGFDDSLAARTTMPQLTTVRQPLRVMGMKAVEWLLTRIQQHQGQADHTEPKPLVFPVERVERASVRNLKAT